ncbi:MAG: SCO family protein [Proteobacteria bacterium]|nr:SCO family protein [Pseudomonadota bacterium]
MPRPALIVALVAAQALGSAAARAAEPLPPQLADVTIAEHLDRQVDLDTAFVDHRGHRVRLRDFVKPGQPLLLTLNYYRCPMLCNLQLNALTRALRQLGWVPGQKFQLVTISINPREGWQLARGKRASYLRLLQRAGAEWHFLVGQQPSIDRVADAVGFRYRWLPEQQQYAHPAAIFFLSPQGRVARYLYGIDYAPRPIKLALIEAAAGRVGSTVDRLLLSCFHYDPTTGRYTPYAVGIMRLGGVATALLLGLTLLALWRREGRSAAGAARAKSPPAA